MQNTTNAEIWSKPDWIGDSLDEWANQPIEWEPAQNCRKRVEQFTNRTASLRHRLGMPLIVAFLGGTGTGKSTLINAVLGEKVVREGKQRPTTDQPILICRPDIDPTYWGIDVSDLKVEKRDLPTLRKTV
ncbi:MAG: GTPase, partial [Thermoguttaceae bacterium]